MSIILALLPGLTWQVGKPSSFTRRIAASRWGGNPRMTPSLIFPDGFV